MDLIEPVEEGFFLRKEKGKRKKRNENNVPSSQFKCWIAATLFPFLPSRSYAAYPG